MRITNSYSYSPRFEAKFFQSEDMEKIAKYAIEHGRFEKLNLAKNNISSTYLQTRIGVKIGQTSMGYPTVEFTRYTPRKTTSFPAKEDDYVVSKPIVYASGKHINPFKFALEQIIKMGNSVPENKTFRKVVVGDK